MQDRLLIVRPDNKAEARVNFFSIVTRNNDPIIQSSDQLMGFAQRIKLQAVMIKTDGNLVILRYAGEIVFYIRCGVTGMTGKCG